MAWSVTIPAAHCWATPIRPAEINSPSRLASTESDIEIPAADCRHLTSSSVGSCSTSPALPDQWVRTARNTGASSDMMPVTTSTIERARSSGSSAVSEATSNLLSARSARAAQICSRVPTRLNSVIGASEARSAMRSDVRLSFGCSRSNSSAASRIRSTRCRLLRSRSPSRTGSAESNVRIVLSLQSWHSDACSATLGRLNPQPLTPFSLAGADLRLGQALQKRGAEFVWLTNHHVVPRLNREDMVDTAQVGNELSLEFPT